MSCIIFCFWRVSSYLCFLSQDKTELFTECPWSITTYRVKTSRHPLNNTQQSWWDGEERKFPCPEFFYVSAELSKTWLNFYGIFHPPTQPPLYSLEGWRLETAVSGLLYLQRKVAVRFLKIDASTLLLPWKRSNFWNTLPCIECMWVIDVNGIFQVPVWFIL